MSELLQVSRLLRVGRATAEGWAAIVHGGRWNERDRLLINTGNAVP